MSPENENYVEITKKVIIKIPLSRQLTEEEIKLAMEESIYELDDGLLLWDEEEEVDTDHTELKIYHDDRLVRRHYNLI